jgi:cell wall-associated NlpC family hydrolase
MKNRPFQFPIVCVVALALVSHPLLAQTAGAATSPAPAPSTPAGVTIVTGATAAAHTVPYTVAAGDSWTKVAAKFNTTRKKLKELNHLDASVDKLTPGQVIQVPASKSKLAAKAAAAKTHLHYAVAQPVQDFDIPASTFASCPVPVPPDEDADAGEPVPPGKHAPVAQLVSPTEMSADADAQQRADQDLRLTANLPAPRLSLPAAPKLAPAPKTSAPTAATKPAPSGWASGSGHTFSAGQKFSATLPPATLTGPMAATTPPAGGSRNDWGFKFLQQARALGDRGIEYDDDWRPPGERTSWTMDCSNTSRWLYKVTTGINLPRTASDQYYYLHLQGKAWDVPTVAQGLPDTNFLRENLKPGDLLFWENTYKPERQPPITHVMVFLGTNAQGQWLMAGSQSSRGGEHNRRNGGPDVYIFRPSQPCGGYTSWFVHHRGRFCAFGRPLEADPSKFALND